MALGSHVQESRFSSILVGFLRFSSIFFGFRRFSSKTLNPVYGPWGPCTGIKVFVDLHRFSSVFVDFRRPFSSIFIDFLRFSSISGMDLEGIWVDLASEFGECGECFFI